MNRKQSPKLFTKEMSVGGHKVTLYSLDEVTWSSNPDEPLQLQSRQEEGRLQLQVKVQAVPKEKPPVATRGGLLDDELAEDEPFEDDDEELVEDEVDLDVDLEDEDEDEDEDRLPVKGKPGSSASKKIDVVKEEVKKVSAVSKPVAMALFAPSDDQELSAKSKKEKKVSGKNISAKVDKSSAEKEKEKKSEAVVQTPPKKKAPEKKAAAVKVMSVTSHPKTKAAKGHTKAKLSNSKPAKQNPSSSKKIEAPQKGKAVNVKVSPSKGKSPGKKG